MVMKKLKNTCAKTRKESDPYEVWWDGGQWWWIVLKKWQAPETEATNPYARWFCAVYTPMTAPGCDLGDTYVREIRSAARQVYSREWSLATKLLAIEAIKTAGCPVTLKLEV